MGLNKDALKVKVSKAIQKLPDTVEVYRSVKNDFNEPSGEVFVTYLTGQYYKGSSRGKSSFSGINVHDGGKTSSRQYEHFMATISDDSSKVSVNDTFTLYGVTYRIIDLGKTLDIYFDFVLERVMET